MFDKILIANRGEIACRIISTARRLGIDTVAVYSDADANAKHVLMADEAVHIGAAPAAESYLNSDRIIDACLKTDAQAVHPGYGFLSENPEFAEAVNAQGLVFIGPSAGAIRAMGLKDAAKTLMNEAGVPTAPGYHGSNQDPDFLLKQAEEVGFPVLIKARAGGGGKGMRLIENASDFKSGLESAQREAQKSFGDAACLIEKFISQPRHIEIQIFGDTHGNIVHAFERDCSLQRRHQKVIEEAPAPHMSQSVRKAMCGAAIKAAQAIDYVGAGTVEFICDGTDQLRDDGFWFMEMNTRLQVEHPVSEAITGLDFVELQLRIASGEVLPVTQNDIVMDGWALEARIYAEDVARGFLPATGELHHLSFPESSQFTHGDVRVDCGINSGDTISPWYDPMIAKLICHGSTRDIAAHRLASALDEVVISGTVTNTMFLAQLVQHKDVMNKKLDTGLIARNLEQLRETPPPKADVLAIAALTLQGLIPPICPDDVWEESTGWRLWDKAIQTVDIKNGETEISARIKFEGHLNYTVILPTEEVSLSIEGHEDDLITYKLGGVIKRVKLFIYGDMVTVADDTGSFEFQKVAAFSEGSDIAETDNSIIAPMPGTISILNYAAGDDVKKGAQLIVMEAMKMEHSLTAPYDGKISEVKVSPGDQVSKGDLLAMLATLEEKDA